MVEIESTTLAVDQGLLMNLPAQMRERPQWALAGGDKAPLSLNSSGKLYNVSVKQLGQLLTFERAIEIKSQFKDYETNHTDRNGRTIKQIGLNIGYVLSADDPFTCIDLDVKDPVSHPNEPDLWTTPAQFDFYWNIVQRLQTYTERSRSGKGLHAWAEGKIGKGFKRDGVEIYSQERFIIGTGDAVMLLPIAYRQEMLTNMVSQMRPVDTEKYFLEELPEQADDWYILQTVDRSANSEKFGKLWRGDWAGFGYSSQSEADMALMSMFTFHSPSNAQCRRLFRESRLGQREKALKNDRYLNHTLKNIRASRAEQLRDGNNYAESIFGAHEQQLLDAIKHPQLPGWHPSASLSPPETGEELLRRLSIDWHGGSDVDVPDIIEGLVADEDVTLLGGHGGVGKSFLALQMACAVALGREVINRSTLKKRVLYYSAEDGKKRLT